MTFETGTATVDSNFADPRAESTRRRRFRIAAAGAALALAIGAGGWSITNRGSASGGDQLPPVVLGESLQPLAVYDLNDALQVSSDPVASLHVRFAMIRKGPDQRSWDLTLAAPDEIRSARTTLVGRHNSSVVLVDGNRYGLGVSYPSILAGQEGDFTVVLPDLATASALAESLTTSVVTGPPMGGVSD